MRNLHDDRTPTERFISQLLEDGIRPSQIPHDRLAKAILAEPRAKYVTVKIPSHSECMIPIDVAKELLARGS